MDVRDTSIASWWRKLVALMTAVFSRSSHVRAGEALCVLASPNARTILGRTAQGAYHFTYDDALDTWRKHTAATLLNARGAAQDMRTLSHVSSYVKDGVPQLTYVRAHGRRRYRVHARQQRDGVWKAHVSRAVRGVGADGALSLCDMHQSLYGVVTHEGAVYGAHGADARTLAYTDEPILTARGLDPDPNRDEYFFDNTSVTALATMCVGDTLLVLYQAPGDGVQHIGGALFDVSGGHFTERWRAEVPLASPPVPQKARFLGAYRKENHIALLWEGDGAIHELSLHNPFADLHEDDACPPFARHEHNPVITANPEHEWEAVATFNPAAVLIDGIVHVLYRALGHGGRSVVGHATSEDGVTFTRAKVPAYVPQSKDEGVGVPREYKTADFRSPSVYGVDGSEDPRATCFEGRVHMYYAAFNGWQQARTAGVSIDEKDLIHGKYWRWSTPVLLTAEPTRWGQGGKNAALMPGTKDGQYAIFHRIWPNICIDYTSDSSLSEYQEPERWLEARATIAPRASFWDSGKVAIGPPPIETDEGWLLLYVGVSQQAHDGYKIGAMLLDKDDPSRVRYRTTRPVLSPRAWYEREGLVVNIAYPCGAVVKDGTLFMYYGGADTYVCVATAPLNEFLEHVKRDSSVDMDVRTTRIQW